MQLEKMRVTLSKLEMVLSTTITASSDTNALAIFAEGSASYREAAPALCSKRAQMTAARSLLIESVPGPHNAGGVAPNITNSFSQVSNANSAVELDSSYHASGVAPLPALNGFGSIASNPMGPPPPPLSVPPRSTGNCRRAEPSGVL
jgi:hypothetical protein